MFLPSFPEIHQLLLNKVANSTVGLGSSTSAFKERFKMHTVTCQLTITFDGSFYRAIFESYNQNTYTVYQKVLGTTEPKLPLLEQLILKYYYEFSFSSGIELSDPPYHQKINPKRLQRKVHREETSISTKAQKALKQQREEIKSTRQLKKKKQKQQKKQKKFKQKQEKKRLKKRGH
ncbi:YjdF family protein [Fructobacillus americanaquae]|uniref:DUF2992 family protein n=1 Tax=Fructobacillus americanaquae TaxID=2940302 RepID=A0ABY5BZ89_9LACO|nr:YjdF family protein [Fructobacillus americanaquae]USS91556.1 DUF2992 family protein [Fructobacillus americanaquae]